MRPTEAPFNESGPATSNVRTVPQKRRIPPVARRAGRNAPTTFFVRTEEELDQMSSATSLAQPQRGTFGVQSLSSTFDADATAASHQEEHGSIFSDGDNSALEPRIWERRTSDVDTAYSGHSPTTSPERPPRAQLGPTILSTPLTPLYLRSPVAGSGTESGAPSTPKSVSLRSLRLSDDESGPEDSASQAITSSGEEDEDVEEKEELPIAPQLVMPSISMPSRRPFTDRGKNIGKLKIMVAGPKGCGKSFLIRSIVQVCDDIVHVDSASGSSMTSSNYDGHRSSVSVLPDTRQITEIYASTRAYPSWWSELDESRVLRRRKSLNEPVLERNICFIDTPGICDDLSSHSQSDCIVEYIEKLLWRSQAFSSFSDGEILSILSGNGSVQVDLVIFVLSDTPRLVDLDLIRRLSQITNVMPVIGKADLISPENLATLKASWRSTLQTLKPRPFLFGTSVADLLSGSPTNASAFPYAVSSAASPDDDNMDASLLMSSTYVQPILASDLTALTTRLFDPDTAAHLRHTSARKLLQWRRSLSPQPSRALQPPTLHPTSASATTSGTSSNFLTTTAYNHPYPNKISLVPARPTPSPFQLARIADHTDREDRLSQVRLAHWAADLQRSLQNERARYAQLQRDERRAWLAERMSECVDEELASVGLLEYSTEPGVGRTDVARMEVTEWAAAGGGKGAVAGGLNARDPLGLLEWDDRVRRRGVAVVKVLGGCGVVGALALWVLRSWGVAGCGLGFGGVEWGHVWSWGWWGPNE